MFFCAYGAKGGLFFTVIHRLRVTIYYPVGATLDSKVKEAGLAFSFNDQPPEVGQDAFKMSSYLRLTLPMINISAPVSRVIQPR